MSEGADLARRSAAALGWSWGGGAARAVLQLVAQIALARLLGPQSFGQASAALLVLGIAALVAEFGLSAALVQRRELSPSDAGFALTWVLLLALLASAALALAAPGLATWMGDPGLEPLLLATACIVPLQPLSNLPWALLQRQLLVKRQQAIQLVSYLLAYGGVGVGAAWLGMGAWSLLAAYATHAVLAGLLALLSLRGVTWRPHLGARRQRTEVLGYGARTTGANLINWSIESVDRLVVGAVHGPASLGLYTVAANLVRAPAALLVTSIQPVAFAAAARLQDERDRLRRGYLALITLALFLTMPLFGLLAWHAETLVVGLYGAAWAEASWPLAWLCAGVPCFVVLALTGPVLRGLDQVGSESRAHAVALLLLGLGLWATRGLPPWAVAMVVSLMMLLRAVLVSAALRRLLGLSWRLLLRCWWGPLLLLLLTLGACALGSLLGSATWAQAWLPLVLSAAISALACALALRVRGAALLGEPLVLALRNRGGDWPAVAALCRWCRLA